ncbi:hypothetical protein G4228_017601 [Cervus hanglu yarkandensis]|nr:hypothetical protein G4228_017601 [Cervus hanglu yarkandensis]
MATPGSEPQPFVPALSVATLHPHHHPHHHHGGTGASGGAAGGGGGGGGGGFNLPLNRGLERALEEAANSGGLNLSARKLKEFPRTAAPAHDLSDTVQAGGTNIGIGDFLAWRKSVKLVNHLLLRILKWGLLHELVCETRKKVPSCFAIFDSITRNQLSALPACLCGLPLKVLIASNNKLGSLPEEIGQLKQLMELDVSCNEITALPQQIGQLKSLRELNVRRNYLKVLPQELVDLPLVKFDFSCNKVLVIPICFREMKQLQVLLLENNPLQSPPAQERTEACEELLRIEEDAHWPSEGTISASKEQDIDIAMIKQLREAVDLLQDPNRLSTDITERSVVNFYPVDPADDLELQDSALNGQIQLEASPECEVQNDLTLQSNGSEYSPNEMRENSPAVSPTSTSTALFGLKPRSVFLRPQRNLESIDPQFTIRRKMEQMREEKELVEQLRESIEMRLKVSLHEDLGAALMDGVVLCHLVNHIRPRSVASIHVPSPAVADLCSPYDILQLDFRHIRKTVDTLLALGEKPPQPTSALRSRDLISFCLVHILFVVLIYITYRWNALPP